MSNKEISPSNNYNNLVSRISETYTEGKQKAIAAVDKQITETYWKVGEHIVITSYSIHYTKLYDFFNPCKIGPMATALAERCTAL